jgi:hypothetical protein
METTDKFGINNYALNITKIEGVCVTVIKQIGDERERERERKRKQGREEERNTIDTSTFIRSSMNIISSNQLRALRHDFA